MVEVIDSIRTVVIDALVSDMEEVIFTFVYTGTAGDRAFVRSLEDMVRARQADVHFVRLVCAPGTLLKRVEDPSRRMRGKLSNREILEEGLSRHDYYARYPSPRTIVINTDILCANEAASIIDQTLPLRGR